MKKYIKPECEIVDVLSEAQLLQGSPDSINDELGDENVWLAPEVGTQSHSFWE